MPGHNQGAIESARIVLVGAGGLGSWIGLGLARLGVRHLTIFDGDSFDRSNLARQLAFGGDLQQPKADALARNLVPHMTNRGQIASIGGMFDDKAAADLDALDLLIVGVDNNRARLMASQFALTRTVPAIFAMLSSDGLRARVLMQKPGGACLSCVLPDLDPDSRAPCAAASIASCFLAASHALELAVAGLSGHHEIPTWRESSLDGSTERIGSPHRHESCRACQRRSLLPSLHSVFVAPEIPERQCTR